MDNFNQGLINQIKLFHSESGEDFEEKYSFIRFVFSNLESINADDIEVCEEEFESLKSNLDAFYYDEDSNVYNLYLALYNENLDDNSFVTKCQIDSAYEKIKNFIGKTVSGKFICFDQSSFTYEIAKDIYASKGDREIVVNVVTNYNVPESYKKDVPEEIGGINVSFRTYDLSDLVNKFGQLNNETSIMNCEEAFGQSIKAIQVFKSIDFDVYLFGMKGTWLARLYKEDSTRLLEQNVRSYLKRTARVNAGILDTIKNGPEQFISYNNGISAVSTNVALNKNHIGGENSAVEIEVIDNFQIVNGGQTTATLYECLKDRLDERLEEVIVPVKLTVVKNIGYSEDFIRNISVYSNTQTAIKKSDPPSNLPFYLQIKKLSSKCLSTGPEGDYICYFERTLGEYQTELKRNNSSKRFLKVNPKKMKFDKIDLARAVNCWQQLPYVVCQGREKNFSYFNDIAKNQLTLPDEAFFKKAYAVVLLYRWLEKRAKALNLSVKSNVVAYTIALISYRTYKKLDLLKIWNSKDIDNELSAVANNVMPKINEIIIKASTSQPEPRMWARKEQCWDLIKKIEITLPLHTIDEKTEFFLKNEALAFISDNDNFYNSLTWMKLILWDGKVHILSKSQLSVVKYMRGYNDGQKQLTKRQIDFLKDTFLAAVKRGYNYK